MLTTRAMIAGALVLDDAERMEVLESLALEPERVGRELWCCRADDDGGVGLRDLDGGGVVWVCEGASGAWREAGLLDAAGLLEARLDGEMGCIVNRGEAFDFTVAGVPMCVVLFGGAGECHRGMRLYAPRWAEIDRMDRATGKGRGGKAGRGGAGRGSGQGLKVQDGEVVAARRGPSEDQRGGARAALEVKGDGLAVRKGGRGGQEARARDGV